MIDKDDDEIKRQETYLKNNLRDAFRLTIPDDSLSVPNRNRECEKLHAVLSDCVYPKKRETAYRQTLIIRTDIRKFYESIDPEKLMAMLKANAFVSKKSKELVCHLIKEYQSLSGEKRGLPRGASISSLLAEVFMVGFDRDVRNNMATYIGVEEKFYCRFVNDIIFIFQPLEGTNKEKIRGILKDTAAEYNLEIHAGKEKTQIIKIKDIAAGDVFNYLGYEFTLGKTMRIDIAGKRFNKLKERIVRCFIAYANRPSVRSADLLCKRIRLISSNFRFQINNRSVTAGINSSNPLIPASSRPARIFALDKVYRDCVKKYVRYKDNLRVLDSLGRTPFRDGFKLQRFIHMPSYKKYQNLAIWKHEQ